MQHFDAADAVRQGSASFDSAAFDAEIDRLIERCTPDLIARASELGTSDGIPAFGQIPLLRKATSNNERDETQNELLVIVTPHIVKNSERDSAAEIWLSPAH